LVEIALQEGESYHDDGGGAANGLGRKVSLLEVGYRDISRHVDKLEVQISTLFDKLTTANEAGELRLSANIDKLQQNLAERQRLNWPFIVTLLGFGFVLFSGVISGFYFLSSQNTANLLQPFALRVEVLNQAVGANGNHMDKVDALLGDISKELQANDGNDRDSMRDRGDTHQRLDRMQDQLTRLAGEQIATTSALGEVETQVDSVEQTRNIADDTLRRDIARLSRTLKIPYVLPVEPSPRIADRRRLTR
jgi:hypothetical protein